MMRTDRIVIFLRRILAHAGVQGVGFRVGELNGAAHHGEVHESGLFFGFEMRMGETPVSISCVDGFDGTVTNALPFSTGISY